MKPISLLSLLLFLYLYSSAQNITAVYFPHAVHPKSSILKQYTITRELIYRYKAENKAGMDSTLVESIYYDSSGKIKERRVFSPVKAFAGTTVYFYNKDDKLIKEISYDDSAKTSIKSNIEIYYDSNAVSNYI